MFTLNAGLPHVLTRLQELEMDSLRSKYSDFQLWQHFMYCETDEEYSIVYSELI